MILFVVFSLKLSHDSSEPWLSGFITVFDFIRSLSSCER